MRIDPLKKSCANCKKVDSCKRPIRLMASKDELNFIMCIEHEEVE